MGHRASGYLRWTLAKGGSSFSAAPSRSQIGNIQHRSHR